MKFPDDVGRLLERRFHVKKREWLKPQTFDGKAGDRFWPLQINLDGPGERAAMAQADDVRSWVSAWQTWRGAGSLHWDERRWKTLGTQRLPDKLILNGPAEVAKWAGETEHWERAAVRYAELVAHWPGLGQRLPRHFDVLAQYADRDFGTLMKMLEWLCTHPGSGRFPRQLPVLGADSKWLEPRMGLLTDLVAAIQGLAPGERDFFQCCGLKAPPQLVRFRVLDPGLRSCVGGLGDVTVPVEQAADLDLRASTVFVVENLQTGLAFDDLPGAVVVMALGYNVDVLARLPWTAGARGIYWGDLDTHGFAILHRARTYLPGLESILMDERTLLNHRDLCVEEKTQHSAKELSNLNALEKDLYLSLKQNRWGQNIRLEQERISWDTAWDVLRGVIR